MLFFVENVWHLYSLLGDYQEYSRGLSQSARNPEDTFLVVLQPSSQADRLNAFSIAVSHTEARKTIALCNRGQLLPSLTIINH